MTATSQREQGWMKAGLIVAVVAAIVVLTATGALAARRWVPPSAETEAYATSDPRRERARANTSAAVEDGAPASRAASRRTASCSLSCPLSASESSSRLLSSS